MLVLSRRPGEVIVIGENIKITVKSVRGEKVSLGIDAPREISVRRSDELRFEPDEKAKP